MGLSTLGSLKIQRTNSHIKNSNRKYQNQILWKFYKKKKKNKEANILTDKNMPSSYNREQESLFQDKFKFILKIIQVYFLFKELDRRATGAQS